MSTPTTATATIPHSHYHHSSHHHFPYYSTNTTASYRSTANQLLPSSSRLAPSYPAPTSTSTSSYAPSSSTQTSSATINGSSFSSNSSLVRSHRQDPIAELPPILDQNYTTMPAGNGITNGNGPASSGSTQTSASSSQQQASRKRRRNSPVDWKKFYGGQPPKEIIVIDDDSPEPESAAVSAVQAHTLTNGNGYAYTNGTTSGAGVSANTSAARHAPKRRKRDDNIAVVSNSGTRYDPVHQRMNGSTTTPHQNGTTPSTISSSDRTSSAIHTTAATSLGSLSSNGQYDYEAQPGQKRKRTTRQQAANDVKRREQAIVGHNYPTYHPPPHPPKKAGDVRVRVIPDVSRLPGLSMAREPLTNVFDIDT